MTNEPILNFPLLLSDQADVTRMFLDLKRESNHIGHAPPATSTQEPHGPFSWSDDGETPRELLDLE